MQETNPISVHMRHRFESSFLADGDKAMSFRIAEVEPHLSQGRTVVFDFEGIENMTDSFANACFVSLFFTNREKLGSQIQFKNCSPIARHFILSALALADALAKENRR